MQKYIEKSFPGARGDQVRSKGFKILLLNEKISVRNPCLLCLSCEWDISCVLAVKGCHPILKNSLDLIPQIWELCDPPKTILVFPGPWALPNYFDHPKFFRCSVHGCRGCIFRSSGYVNFFWAQESEEEEAQEGVEF